MVCTHLLVLLCDIIAAGLFVVLKTGYPEINALFCAVSPTIVRSVARYTML